MAEKILRNKWTGEYYSHDELFPLKKYKFGDLNLSGPNYPLGYLNRMYPDWQIYGIQTFNHKTMSVVNHKVILDHSNPLHRLRPYLAIQDNVSKNKNDNPYLRELYNINHDKNVLIIK